MKTSFIVSSVLLAMSVAAAQAHPAGHRLATGNISKIPAAEQRAIVNDLLQADDDAFADAQKANHFVLHDGHVPVYSVYQTNWAKNKADVESKHHISDNQIQALIIEAKAKHWSDRMAPPPPPTNHYPWAYSGWVFMTKDGMKPEPRATWPQ